MIRLEQLAARAAGAGLALLAGACGGGSEPLAPVAPVVVIGVDGLDPVVTEELLRAGRLPNLARFAEEGVLAPLGTFAPTWSPVIWTTIATGQALDVHGIDNFLDPAGNPFTSNARRVPALWDLASAAGRTVDCTGWWITWPAERINGRMVASYAAQAQAQVIWKPTLWAELEDQTWPPELAAEIGPLLVLADDTEALLPVFSRAFPVPAEPGEHFGRLVNDLAWTHAADLSITAVATHFLATGGADLSLAYLALPDVAGHRFWRYWRPEDMEYEVSAEDLATYGDFLALAYVEADRLVGELLAEVPADATVVLLSDHGMHHDPKNKYEPLAIASGAHEDAAPGLIGLLGPAVQPLGDLLDGPPVGDVFRVAPLVLNLLDVPVPSHWRGAAGVNPLAAVLQDTWRLEHPPRLGPSPDAAFRPATASILPSGATSEQFIDAFQGLGYLGGNELLPEPGGDGAPYSADSPGDGSDAVTPPVGDGPRHP